MADLAADGFSVDQKKGRCAQSDSDLGWKIKKSALGCNHMTFTTGLARAVLVKDLHHPNDRTVFVFFRDNDLFGRRSDVTGFGGHFRCLDLSGGLGGRIVFGMSSTDKRAESSEENQHGGKPEGELGFHKLEVIGRDETPQSWFPFGW